MYMYIWLCNVPLRIYSKIKCCILCHLRVTSFLKSHTTLASSQHNTAAFLFMLLIFYVHEHIRKIIRHYRNKFVSHLKNAIPLNWRDCSHISEQYKCLSMNYECFLSAAPQGGSADKCMLQYLLIIRCFLALFCSS